MKKISTLFCAGVLMSALCVACNEPKNQGEQEPPEAIGVSPVPVSEIPEEVTAFFKENVALIGSSFFYEYNDFGERKNVDGCVMINSTEELKAPMAYSVDLPAIDFDKYTLVIGKATMPGTGYAYLGQSLDVESNPAKLNLRVKIPDGSYAVLCPLYYWGLYPKLSKAAIEINVVYEGRPI